MQHAQKISFSGEADEADFLRSREVGEFLSGALAGAMTKVVLSPLETIRYGYNRHCWSEDEKGMKNNFIRTQIGAHKKRRLSFSPQACSALVTTRNSSLTNFCQENIDKIPYVNCHVLIIHANSRFDMDVFGNLEG